MATGCPQMDPIFGYLSMLESTEHGYFGGYLLVSLLGRPLEFHCTAPVRPSRAQQILYGPTLQPYLLGEQIGGTLLAQAKVKAKVILTDQFDAFCLRSQSDCPMVCLAGPDRGSADSKLLASLAGDEGFNAARSPDSFDSRCFSLGGFQWELPSGYEHDRSPAVDLLQLLAQHVELPEPFGRIHEAIREAQRIGQRNQDTHGQAA
jgi:hypothetical protein